MVSIDNWIKYLVVGVLMISLSNIIFGGLAYAIMLKSIYWTYLTFLGVGGFSSLVSGVLMVYDSLRLRVMKEVKGERHEGVNKDRIKNHIKFLREEAIRMNPESESGN